jgi:mRNA-degrading endonuclease RelE of RelBE toxin-antitoxin system
MRSRITADFREAFRELPPRVQEQARKAYRLFLENPSHTGLNFKKLQSNRNLYSARVGLGYRAVGRLEGSDMIWFWIGPHAEYDRRV